MSRSNGDGASSQELLAVRHRAIALADAILRYSRALDNYRRALGRAHEAGATQAQAHHQVEIAASTSPERAFALREFAAKLKEQETP